MNISKNNIVHVILTGGVGSRLWPLSRKSMPKQYLELFNNKSLFQLTVERNSDIANTIVVVGNIDNNHLSKNTLLKTKKEYVNIVESTPRNTAAAIAFAAFSGEPDDILIVTPSDHVVDGKEAYKTAIECAVEKAIQGSIVTFGIIPTKPETGYGYIEYENDSVLSFREKPSEAEAKNYIERGNFLWNSGMFCFKASVLLAELKQYAPEVYVTSKNAWKQNKKGKLNFDLSMKIPSISIDYAVMERSKKIKVVPAKFQWSDLGSFDSVYDYLIKNGHPIDENGNMVIGSSAAYTLFLGLKNTIFINTPSANLILQKDFSQQVKEIYNHLEKKDPKLIN